MPKHTTIFLVILAVQWINLSPAQACGYDWIGDCSSSIHLRINGTLDSFNIAACPSGLNYQGQFLGKLQSLSLANVKTVTWESCQNNVTSMTLKYRIYESGGAGGSFTDYFLTEDYNTVQGPYTTRYSSHTGNTDLTTGLSIGQTYVLEVYLVAMVDTIGDDMVPETQLVKDNNGAFYQLTFLYGGPNAAPFVAIPSAIKIPTCHDDTNGLIRISVWGDQTDLTYQWSNMPLNFYQQDNLAGGAYEVTVTGANHQEIVPISLPNPEPIVINEVSVLAVGCNNVPGEAFMGASGGIGQFSYFWSDGQTSEHATFNAVGVYTLTVLDANGCSAQKDVAIEQADPGFLVLFLPDGVYLTCAHPVSTQCVEEVPGASYQWYKNNVPTVTGHCNAISTGGLHKITINWQGCVASRTMNIIDETTPPTALITGTATAACQFDSIAILLTAQSTSFITGYSWVYQGQEISTSNTCPFVITELVPGPNGMLVPVLPVLTVTDAAGCTGIATNAVTIVQGVPPSIFGTVTNPTGQNGTNGTIQVQVIGGTAPFEAIWSNGSTDLSITGLSAGEYCLTVTDDLGCTRTKCFLLVGTSATQDPYLPDVLVYPNPVSGGARVQVFLPSYPMANIRELLLWSPDGRLIQKIAPSEMFHESKMVLDVNGPSGIYTLEVLLNKSVVRKKIAVLSDN